MALLGTASLAALAQKTLMELKPLGRGPPEGGGLVGGGSGGGRQKLSTLGLHIILAFGAR